MSRCTNVRTISPTLAVALWLAGCGNQDHSSGPPPDPLEPLAQVVVFTPTWVDAITGDTVSLPSNGDWDFDGIQAQGEMRVAPGMSGVLRVHSIFYAPLSVVISVPDTIREIYLTDHGIFRPLVTIHPTGLTVLSANWSSDFSSTILALDGRHLDGMQVLSLDSIFVSWASCDWGSYFPACAEGSGDYFEINPEWDMYPNAGDTTGTARIELHRAAFPNPETPTPFGPWLVWVTAHIGDTRHRRYRVTCTLQPILASSRATTCSMWYESPASTQERKNQERRNQKRRN